jgi:type IV secretory pathway TraG/TraD family ATPase VirD4
MLFRAGDLETARMVSAWLGRTSVPAVSVTTRGRGERSTTVRPYVRPLAAVEDVVGIPEGALIALTGAARPLALEQARYFEVPGLARMPPPFPLSRRKSPVLLFPSPRSPSPVLRRPPPPPEGGVRG